MDNVSSLECLKLDSQSEVLGKNGGENDLFLPAMVPLNCDTPIINANSYKFFDIITLPSPCLQTETRTEESETIEPTEEELIAYFWSKTEESEDEESMDWKSKDEESMDWKSEDEESDNWKSEVEESDDEKSNDGKSYGECKYCLKVDKHPTQLCSYRYRVPKNAIVGESCVVACRVCGCLFRDSCCADCGLSVGRALLKECTICGKEEEHSNFECPEREEKRKDSGFTYDPYTGSFSVEIRPLK